MQGRIACVSNCRKNTAPRTRMYYGSRVYQFAPPGKIYHYVDGASIPTISDLEDRRYGLVIVDDFSYEEPRGSRVDMSWEGTDTRIVYGHTKDQAQIKKHGMGRADDLAQQWERYGAVRIDGQLPTEDEIKKGGDARRSHANKLLNQAIRNQALRRQGHGKGLNPEVTDTEDQWAAEYGVQLRSAIDILAKESTIEQKDSGEVTMRVNCPECGEAIMPQAKLCIHCKKKFGMTAEEYLTQPQAQEVGS